MPSSCHASRQRRKSAHRFIESNMSIAAVEPPTHNLLAVAVRPFLDHLGPLAGEFQVDWLIGGPLEQAKRLLRRVSWLGVWQGR